jgi:hypothetical protein
MARPARFREELAATNEFLRSPQLALGEVDQRLFEPATVNGVLIHGPRGRSHTEEDQALGFLVFAVPDPDYEEWAATYTMAEILGLGTTREEQIDNASPTPKWRSKRRRGNAQGGE